jgi:pimeloyl-ACP methyl ester carboxylesterase
METTRTKTAEESLSFREIEIRVTILNYIEKGTGEAVVFILGAVSDLRTWMEQVEAFSPHYRAVSYSRRYHEPNAGANGGAVYSRASQTADLVEFIERLGLAKAHLVGHSYGASIALLAAAGNPELVASLTLGEPSPFPSLMRDQAASLLNGQQAAFEEVMRMAENGEPETAVREFLHTVVGVDVLKLLPEERRAVVLENAGTLLPMLRTYYDSPPIGREQLKSLNIPTLLVTGELSPKISRLSNEAIAGCLPDAKTAVLRGASHGLQIENPAGFNHMVLKFLSENKSSSRPT